MLIVTLPEVTSNQLEATISNPLVGGVRYNVGMRTPFTPRETLSRIKELTDRQRKPFWIDLKGRQLRITRWADPDYGEIEVNHNFTVDLPATVVFRGGDRSTLIAVSGNRLYVTPNPANSLGAGQAINVLGTNLRIDGYLTQTDEAYIDAANSLGFNRFMLSFIETPADILAVAQRCPNPELVLKIESLAGMALANQFDPKQWKNCRLMAARDDLMVQLDDSPALVLRFVHQLIERDPNAIAASHLLTSVSRGPVSAADLSDLYLLHQWGYRDYLLSDTISQRYLQKALSAWRNFQVVVDKV